MKNKIYKKIQKFREEMEHDWTLSEFEDCLNELELVLNESKIWDDNQTIPKIIETEEVLDLNILLGRIDSIIGWICEIIKEVDKKELLALIDIINELKSVKFEINKIGKAGIKTTFANQTRCYSFVSGDFGNIDNIKEIDITKRNE